MAYTTVDTTVVQFYHSPGGAKVTQYINQSINFNQFIRQV